MVKIHYFDHSNFSSVIMFHKIKISNRQKLSDIRNIEKKKPHIISSLLCQRQSS